MEVSVRSIFIGLASVFIGLSVWGAESNDRYSMTFNYQLNMVNPAGTNPTQVINLTASPSLIRNDVHEYGGSLSYSVNKAENTLANTTTESSTTALSAFYRFNIPMGDSNAKYPLIGYAGPQVGIISMKAGNSSTSNTSAGGQVGLNMMLSQNLAINFHVLQFDTVFATETQLLVTQSIGVKYFFQ